MRHDHEKRNYRKNVDLSRGPSFYQSTFRKQVAEWIPIGSAVVDAEKIMKAKGFCVERIAVESSSYDSAHEELNCSRKGGAEPTSVLMLVFTGATQRWTVSLRIKEERIDDIIAFSGGYAH